MQALPEAVELAQEEGTAPEAPAGFAELSADTLFADDTLLAADAGQWQPRMTRSRISLPILARWTAMSLPLGNTPGRRRMPGLESALGMLSMYSPKTCSHRSWGPKMRIRMSPQDDVDALFESLGLQSAEGDDPPVMAVEENPVSGGHLQLVKRRMDRPRCGGARTAVCHELSIAPDPLPGIAFFTLPGGGDIFADFLGGVCRGGIS